MHRLSISLTESQRRRLEELQKQRGFRSISAAAGWAIDQAWIAYQERETENVGAQNPELEAAKIV